MARKHKRTDLDRMKALWECIERAQAVSTAGSRLNVFWAQFQRAQDQHTTKARKRTGTGTGGTAPQGKVRKPRESTRLRQERAQLLTTALRQLSKAERMELMRRKLSAVQSQRVQTRQV
jgi:hypothetical protein